MSEPWTLELDQASLAAQWPYDHGLDPVSMRLAPGDLALVLLDAGADASPLGDLAAGLIEPDAGRVRFEGRDWLARAPGDAAAARSRIGRVFPASRWLSNLDVDENITLAPRHHTRRAESEIEAEAVVLARAFGLPDLPRARPALVRPAELRLADWTRAFLGDRSLIVLEFPLAGVYGDRWAALLEQVRLARERGVAFLWLQHEQRDELERGLNPAGVWEVRGDGLRTVERKHDGKTV